MIRTGKAVKYTHHDVQVGSHCSRNERCVGRMEGGRRRGFIYPRMLKGELFENESKQHDRMNVNNTI